MQSGNLGAEGGFAPMVLHYNGFASALPGIIHIYAVNFWWVARHI